MQNKMQLVCENRLRSVLVRDKQDNPQKILAILKSELLFVLKNYMEIDAENLDLDIFVKEHGFYEINLNAKVCRLKTVSYYLDREEI